MTLWFLSYSMKAMLNQSVRALERNGNWGPKATTNYEGTGATCPLNFKRPGVLESQELLIYFFFTKTTPDFLRTSDFLTKFLNF